jgi:cytochrome c553
LSARDSSIRIVARTTRLGVFVLATALLAGCRQDMNDQPVIEPFEASTIFDDSSGSRPIQEGTVARGHLHQNRELYTGLTVDDEMVTELPVTVTRELLLNGQSKFDTFCSPCHGRAGNGLGMIVRRGFKQPASFHEQRLLQQPVGYFYTVISNGFGEMSSYASQIAPRDRWAIVAYLRTLQWSREVPLQSLPEEVRSRAESALNQPSGSEPESGHGAE